MSASNVPGLSILMEEKEGEVFNSEQSTDCIPLKEESLLPPLPSSSSSLPIETSTSTIEEVPKNKNSSNNLPSYQVSTASLESMLHGVNIDGQNLHNSRSTSDVIEQPGIDMEPISEQTHQDKHHSQSLVKDVYGRSSSSTNLQSQGSETNNSTRQGSVSSLNSTVSVSSNRALKKIKSGFKKLSSPLTLTPKIEPKEEFELVEATIELTDKNAPTLFKRPFLPRHTSTLSNASNSSSASSQNPLSLTKHSHTNSSTSNRTMENLSNLFTSPMSSPVIAINEKFGSRASSDGSEYHFLQQHQIGNDTGYLFDKLTLNQFDTIDEKVTYIESLKRQMENEDAAYKITERRLLTSGWATESEILDLQKRRDATLKRWKDSIDRLESTLYGSTGF